MSTSSSPRDIAVTFTQAWAHQDFDRAAGYLADDVEFDGPAAGHITGKQQYMDALSRFAVHVTGIEFICALGDDEQAAIFYNATTSQQGTNTFAERLVIRDGKIVSDRLVFDTNPAHAAGTPPPTGQ
jgi:hypothetical protein